MRSIGEGNGEDIVFHASFKFVQAATSPRHNTAFARSLEHGVNMYTHPVARISASFVPKYRLSLNSGRESRTVTKIYRQQHYVPLLGLGRVFASRTIKTTLLVSSHLVDNLNPPRAENLCRRERSESKVVPVKEVSNYGESDVEVVEPGGDLCARPFRSMMFCLVPVCSSVSSALADLSGNHVFMSAFWSWFIAQIAKLFTAWYREGTWDYKVMFDSGGMPSSHTALVVGLTTSIALQFGLGSVYFPLSLAFSLIVMYDAAGVRRHAGKQAQVLNKIIEDMFHGSAISDEKLKEVLGHSPLQVVCGAILGVVVGTAYMFRCT